MDYPSSLVPSSTEAFTFPKGQTVRVPKARPEFAPWTGQPPADTYGGKPVLSASGRPAFAELVILDAFRASGWDGVWIDTYRNELRTGYWDIAPLTRLPDAPAELLRRIVESRGGVRRGTWDVFCWRDGNVLFAESKRAGKDTMKPDQVLWLEAALKQGLSQESFLVVEWQIGGSARTAV